jgi:hypothetical protein
MKYHYTISGNDEDGWSLCVYKRIEKDVITTHWLIPRTYDTLDQLADDLDELRNEN